MPSQPTDPSSDKPFNDEPFDAGVEADEESDPKKFIEQLTGKLGQSLRKYNESNGQPDFELEKFAINSLLSATHTSQMDNNDQDDIIKKIKESGNSSDSESSSDNSDDSSNELSDNPDNSNSDNSSGSLDNPEGEDINEIKDSLFITPKKNNMFQPGSNDILKNNENRLKESIKNRIFGKNKIKESLNQDNMHQPETKPAIIDPIVEPKGPTISPEPSRKNKPFLPSPDIQTDPKAKI